MPTHNPEATVWKSNAAIRSGYEHRVPSGQLCLLKPMDLQTLVLEGIIEDIDSVTSLVNSDIMKKQKGGKKTTDQKVKEGMQFLGSKDGRTAIQIMNDVLPHVVISPAVLPIPDKGEERDPEAIYVDDIDINDRADIFAEVMKGVEKTAQFREGSA